MNKLGMWGTKHTNWVRGGINIQTGYVSHLIVGEDITLRGCDATDGTHHSCGSQSDVTVFHTDVRLLMVFTMHSPDSLLEV